MNSSLAGILQIVLLVAALAVCYKPLGDYMARVFLSPKHLRVEKGFYRVMGIDPDILQQRAEAAGAIILQAVADFPHGWRDVILEDPDGYIWAVGVPMKK